MSGRSAWKRGVFWLAVSCVLACGAGVGGGAAATAAPAVPDAGTASWGNAQVVPGPGGAPTAVFAVSCTAPGDCAAGGGYGGGQAFVVSESGGVWGSAQAVPGLAALNTGGDAVISAISCTAPGYCAIGGTYAAQTVSQDQAFVDNETDGVWATAIEVPGSGALNVDDGAGVGTVSCASAGNCVAGGSYEDASGDIQAFMANESNGTWESAQEVPGTAALNVNGNAQVISVACPSAGNCSAVGNYADYQDEGEDQAFVVDETDGNWGTATQMEGLSTLEGDLGISYADTISCPSAGTCGVVGTYWNGDADDEAFVANETAGVWDDAQQVPGIGTLTGPGGVSWSGNGGCDAGCEDISCPAAGYCTAAGGMIGGFAVPSQAFVVDETNGTWGNAQEIPNIATLNGGDTVNVNAVSCGSPGNCSTGGNYLATSNTPTGDTSAFVADETGGVWGNAQQAPGTAALGGSSGANLEAIWCVSATNCVAGGTSASGGWTADKSHFQPTTTSLSLSGPTVTYGNEQAEQVSVAVAPASGTGTPTGMVKVTAGSATLCAITLASGTGSCTLAAAQLAAGTVSLTASYGGDSSFSASSSASSPLTVAKASSTASLTRSTAKVTYGRERDERLSVVIAAQYQGTPGGTVKISGETTTLCTITLASGKGSCRISDKKLRAGTYHLVAVYGGNADFVKSTSAASTLKVLK
jgi:hypothetical protein